MRNYRLAILTVALLLTIPIAAWASQPATNAAAPGKKIVVYYFRNNYRCTSCKKIEAYTSETVTSKFADDIKKGLLTFQTVNVDEPANKHYVKEYYIVTKQVVLVEMKNGAQTRWKNLDKIWELLGNETNFRAYVEKEVRDFKGGK